jgi:hypothetical protein
MRLTRLLGATLGTGFLFLALSSGASAWDHWRDRDHWRHDRHHRYEHWRHERPVVVRERPVVVERPVMMAPQPMYMQPMMPYNQGPSGLNLNFNIPLN